MIPNSHTLPTALRPVLLACLLFISLFSAGSAWSLDNTFREIDWESLIPPGWNPDEPFERYSDNEIMQMTSEEISQLEAESQMIFDAAPSVQELNGEEVRMPGYLLPLEFEGDEVSEFFLVPYLGACIHVPPPPANQIVYGRYEEGYEVEDLYTPVWISGTLQVDRSSNQLGETGFQATLDVTSGYTMQVKSIEPYTEPAQ